jgi:hypothetical protein
MSISLIGEIMKWVHLVVDNDNNHGQVKQWLDGI